VNRSEAVSVVVSETNLRKTAMRVLGQRLVSTEIAYIQRTLGSSATQQEMDATVLAVRRMPWASIVAPE
jgi:K+/H+ antiporter YhaU regulatory subunit KhtT